MKKIIKLKGLSIIVLVHFLLSSFISPAEKVSKEIPLSKEPTSVEEDRSNDFVLPHAYLLNHMISIDLIYPINKVTINVKNVMDNSILYHQVFYNSSFIQFTIHMFVGEEYELKIIHDKWELNGSFYF